MLIGHGKSNAYINRFKIIQSTMCSFKHADQTTDQFLYDSETHGKEREKIIAYTSREEDWPERKFEIQNKYQKNYKFC